MALGIHEASLPVGQACQHRSGSVGAWEEQVLLPSLQTMLLAAGRSRPPRCRSAPWASRGATQQEVMQRLHHHRDHRQMVLV